MQFRLVGLRGMCGVGFCQNSVSMQALIATRMSCFSTWVAMIWPYARHLIRDIKMDLICLWSLCPDLIMVWSDIVARRVWREARSVDSVNRARAKVNKEVGIFVKHHRGIEVRQGGWHTPERHRHIYVVFGIAREP